MDPRTPVDDVERVGRELAALAARIERLESPSGTSVYQTVAKLSALVNDIQAQLDQYNANRYTNAQIDAKVANPGNISPGTVSASGTVTVGGQLRAPDAVGFNITAARRTVWIEDATGRFGYAPSSLRWKQDVEPASIDPAAVLGIEPRHFRYREQVEAHGDEAPLETGLIAEQVADAGLEFAVTRDADGEVDGVEYSQLVVALLAVARDQGRRLDRLETMLRNVHS